mmetsp:Transcript_581/g.1304  ORF Transcript_581/g.1304 Transcript_581/m.1304 type:complete len:111 (-) Transcript_581:498-830(-)
MMSQLHFQAKKYGSFVFAHLIILFIEYDPRHIWPHSVVWRRLPSGAVIRFSWSNPSDQKINASRRSETVEELQGRINGFLSIHDEYQCVFCPFTTQGLLQKYREAIFPLP